MAGNQAIWGAPMNVSDMPDGVHAMLRTGRISPTNMPWPDNDPRRLMVAGADSGEFAMARGEEMPFAANQGTSADPVAPGSEQPGGEQPGQENGFWQSGWGQGAGILGASVATNFVFGDRSLRGTAQNAVLYSAIALPIMNSEDGMQRTMDGMGKIFRGIQAGFQNEDWSQLQQGFGEIGEVYAEGINNLTGVDLQQSFGSPSPTSPNGGVMAAVTGSAGSTGGPGPAGADATMALGEQTLAAHLDTPAPAAGTPSPTVPRKMG